MKNINLRNHSSFLDQKIFISESNVSKMTEFSGADDNPDCDGNTILLECEANESVFISGFENFKFKSDDKIMEYISFRGNNMCPYAIIIGEKHTFFRGNHYKFIENDKIEEGTLLNVLNGSLDRFEYHLKKCGKDVFKKLDCIRIHSFYPEIEEEDDEDVVLVAENEDDVLVEKNYCNGTNELVKIFNQKFVICYERDSDYVFRQ